MKATEYFQKEKDGGYQSVGDGWIPIVEELHQKLLKIDPEYEVLQIKEKYGGLRYYFSSAIEKYELMEKVVDDAEKKCSETCEWCGKDGEYRNEKYWILTLCDSCHNSRQEGKTYKEIKDSE